MIEFLKPLISPLAKAVTSVVGYILARPKIDINLVLDEGDLYGQKALHISSQQDEAIPAVPFVKYDMEFYWNYSIVIRNNSSKTAYNIHIEEIHKTKNDYLGKLNELTSLKEDEQIDVNYKIRFYQTCNSKEAEAYHLRFPPFVEKLTILVSYTNEARTKFYTLFTMDPAGRSNEHLFFKPKSNNKA